VDFKREPFMGPVIDEIAVKKYEEICKQGEKEGAQALLKSLPIEC
jgi:acyl-CoA reductase-like NAD-dependent aldehyde dehydrogenase